MSSRDSRTFLKRKIKEPFQNSIIVRTTALFKPRAKDIVLLTFLASLERVTNTVPFLSTDDTSGRGMVESAAGEGGIGGRKDNEESSGGVEQDCIGEKGGEGRGKEGKRPVCRSEGAGRGGEGEYTRPLN